MEKKIYQVTEVTLTIIKRNPLTLEIIAKGETNTGGWTKPRLEPFNYIVPPPDGIYEFKFLAEAPTGPATTAITPIETEYQWKDFPVELKGVKITAESNYKVKMLQ